MKLGRAALAILALGACAKPAVESEPSRWDYYVFRARVGELPEPNYLPWALHRETLPDHRQALVACRWPDSAFPLRWWADPPAIPEGVRGEWSARSPEDYVQAVEEAFETWEQAIGRPVRFEQAASAAEAVVVIQLGVDASRDDLGTVLGVVRNEASLCTIEGEGAGDDQVNVRFAPARAEVYVADGMGLLTPRQVRAVALHEIGHLLGVSGQHSPLAGDVMYLIASDRRIEMLSEHDRNTLQALYRLRPGTIYKRLDERRTPPLASVRRDPPKLGEPTRDKRGGFEVRFPRGWQVLRTPSGWVAVDGVSWDYDASLQIGLARGRAGEHFSQLAGQAHARGDDVRAEVFELDGEPVLRISARGPEREEQTDVIQWDEKRVLIVLADARRRDFPLYQPWFQRVLFSLERPSQPASMTR